MRSWPADRGRSGWRPRPPRRSSSADASRSSSATDAPLGDGLPRPWMDYAGAGYYGMVNVARDNGGFVHLAGIHQHDREQQVTRSRRTGRRGDPRRIDRRGHRRRHWTVRRRSTARVDRRASLPLHVDADHRLRDRRLSGTAGCRAAVSACSGHGFKFTITMGVYAAARALGAVSPIVTGSASAAEPCLTRHSLSAGTCYGEAPAAERVRDKDATAVAAAGGARYRRVE